MSNLPAAAHTVGSTTVTGVDAQVYGRVLPRSGYPQLRPIAGAPGTRRVPAQAPRRPFVGAAGASSADAIRLASGAYAGNDVRPANPSHPGNARRRSGRSGFAGHSAGHSDDHGGACCASCADAGCDGKGGCGKSNCGCS